jgi:CheY-like chemotaxis protein
MGWAARDPQRAPTAAYFPRREAMRRGIVPSMHEIRPIVLLIEQHRQLREQLQTVLECEGYVVETAPSWARIFDRLYGGGPRLRVIVANASRDALSVDTARASQPLCGIPLVLDLAIPVEAEHRFRPQMTDFCGVPVVGYSGLATVSAWRRTQTVVENAAELDRVLALVRRYCAA